ncbi:unnamed protein product [Nesidiocoris tenuis]|uniref:Uncharacterized protein n=1 Tax=Nesidiocoris tenuis TaxID=355587 RepID=A0A6H5HKK8_9HEMI|nr:unnamed protein product [Nesidiocoris tenuis]
MRGLQEPVLPKMTSLLEYKSSRSCRSVTLGWIPSSVLPTTNSSQDSSSTLDEQMAAGQYARYLTYCITTREMSKADTFTPAPDQCAHSLALKNHDYTTSFCFHRPGMIMKAERQSNNEDETQRCAIASGTEHVLQRQQ